MRITTSYGVAFKDAHNAIRRTLEYYRSAVNYLVPVVEANWGDISAQETALDKRRVVERLIHGTKKQNPVYDFDKQFYKFPVYLRRAAITSAIGAFSSWKSNHDNWLTNKEGGEPKLGVDNHICPAFYNKNMFNPLGKYTAQIKVFQNNDWVWQTIRLKKTDVDYLKRRTFGRDCEISAPVIVKKPGDYFELRFTLEETVELSNVPLRDQKICAVDLGLNTDATCSIMDVHGTILARKFIRCAREQDSVRAMLHRVSDFQREHGSHDVGRLWAVVKNRNENLANQVARKIVDFALEHQCDVIVFEYLDTSGKKHGSKKQRLHHWKHRDIQKVAESLAHRYGMRISRVCAWNTSRLAYDGSGKVKRGREVSENNPYDICQFTTGKVYNCDLSASYNIGARYFLRGLIGELPGIETEVPNAPSGTRRVLSDLWYIDKLMYLM